MANGNTNLTGRATKPRPKKGVSGSAPRSSLLWNQVKLYATSQQAADLYQRRVLHLDRFVERPKVGQHATQTARQQDDRS